MKRGIITSPFEIHSNSSESFTVTGGVSKTDIRFMLMYWDKITIPDNNLFSAEIPDEIDLRASGVVTRPVINAHGSYFGNEVAKVILRGQHLISQDLLKDKEFDWVVHSLGDKNLILDDFSTSEPNLRIELSNLLPAPSADTPINEILEFKQRRSDELHVLHERIDEIYQEILKAPDVGLAQRKAVLNLKKDIDDLNRVSKEKFKISTSSKFSCDFSLKGTPIAAALLAGELTGFINSSTLISALPLAVLSMINIKYETSASFEPATGRKKLSYLTSAKFQGVLK